MPLDMITVFVILIIAVILFVSERVSFDVTALVMMSALMLTGILTPAEGLSGFSSEATIAIGAMFVLSEGVRQTGALDRVADFFSRLGQRNYWLALVSMMGVIAVVSAFINNTAAVAIFIPVVVMMASQLGVSPSKLLMPLSFASMFGGVCTLIGTSTNLLVNSIAKSHGQIAFSMFEFAPLGLVFLASGLIYLLLIGIPLIPERRPQEDITVSFEMNEYLTEVVLKPIDEKTVDHISLTEDLDLDVVQIFSREDHKSPPGTEVTLHGGDVLRIRGTAQEIKKLLDREAVALKRQREIRDIDLELGSNILVEAVIAPESDLEGQEIGQINFPERFGAIVLAIRHRGQLQQYDMDRIPLSGGDSILLSMDRARLPEFKRDRSFVVVSEVGVSADRSEKMPVALAILVGVVAVAAFNLAPIVVSAVTGAVLLVMTGCLTPEEAYEAINWKVLLLLAGVIPLGAALEKTGGSELISTYVLNIGQGLGPTATLSAFFFLSMMLTNIISNQATAVLLAPIAINAAQTLGVDGRPFLMAVTFAASLSFMTPVGYQTNTLIYGPGQYRFTDFTRIGTPLNILFWIIATLLIPVIWPF